MVLGLWKVRAQCARWRTEEPRSPCLAMTVMTQLRALPRAAFCAQCATYGGSAHTGPHRAVTSFLLFPQLRRFERRGFRGGAACRAASSLPLRIARAPFAAADAVVACLFVISTLLLL